MSKAFYQYRGVYTPTLLRSHPDKYFIFGDNMRRYGTRGQAVIRDEPNALGIATKVAPKMNGTAFFHDSDFHNIITEVVNDLKHVMFASHRRGVVVPFTSDGRISLGLGLARLDEKAPTVYAVISTYLTALAVEAGGWEILGEEKTTHGR